MDCEVYNQKLSVISCIEELGKIGVENSKSIGCDWFLYAGFSQVPIASPRITILGNYPPDWMARYEKKGYAKIDPVMKRVAESVVPFCWSDLEVSGHEIEAFMMDACRHGVCSGMSVPLYSGSGYSAVMSLSSSSTDKDICQTLRSRMGDILLFANSFHEVAIRLSEQSYPTGELSEAEKQCLMWAAEGKTTWEIGQILSIKERTVVYHLNNAAKKLDATNRQQAIARAIAMGELRSSVATIPDKIEFS
jgi:DNA-binding CsgD family transcriptional regulator